MRNITTPMLKYITPWPRRSKAEHEL